MARSQFRHSPTARLHVDDALIQLIPFAHNTFSRSSWRTSLVLVLYARSCTTCPGSCSLVSKYIVACRKREKFVANTVRQSPIFGQVIERKKVSRFYGTQCTVVAQWRRVIVDTLIVLVTYLLTYLLTYLTKSWMRDCMLLTVVGTEPIHTFCPDPRRLPSVRSGC